jgi:hypothetical protein
MPRYSFFFCLAKKTNMSANHILKSGDRKVVKSILLKLNQFKEDVKSSHYFDDADSELVENTCNTFTEKLETTAALSEIIIERSNVIHKYVELADTFHEMMAEFARRQVQMEIMRDKALSSR